MKVIALLAIFAVAIAFAMADDEHERNARSAVWGAAWTPVWGAGWGGRWGAGWGGHGVWGGHGGWGGHGAWGRGWGHGGWW